MAFCQNCGAQLSEGKKFCSSCGHPVEAVEPQAAAQNSNQPPQPPYQQPQPPQYRQAQFQQPQPPQREQFQQPQQPQQQFQQPQQPQFQPRQQNQYQQNLQQGMDKLVNLAQNTADETGSIDPADIEKNKVMGGLAYFLFFLPLIACPDSKYGRFHANQGLVYLLLSVAAGIAISVLTAIFLVISFRLWWLTTLISFVVWIAIIALGIIGLINGFSGKAKELPFVGKIRIIK